MLALLTADLADMPASLLERAISQHIFSCPHMPKAADLVAIAKGFVNRDSGVHGAKGETMAQRGNRMMSPEGLASRLRWHDDGTGGAYLAAEA